MATPPRTSRRAEQAGSWAEAIGLSDAEYASALPGFARDDGAPVATVHARSHSMARQHGFGGYEGLDSPHTGNGTLLHNDGFGDASPTPSCFRSPTITMQSLERVAAMQRLANAASPPKTPSQPKPSTRSYSSSFEARYPHHQDALREAVTPTAIGQSPHPACCMHPAGERDPTPPKTTPELTYSRSGSSPTLNEQQAARGADITLIAHAATEPSRSGGASSDPARQVGAQCYASRPPPLKPLPAPAR